MDEKKTDEEETEKGTTLNSNNRISVKEKRIADMLEETRKATEDLKRLNDEKKDLIAAEKELQEKKEMGGIAEAGQSKDPELTEEQKASNERVKEMGMATGSKWADEM